MSKTPPSVKTLFLAALALICFAANSVLCRLALRDGAIDAGSFTLLRLLAGVVILMIILQLRPQQPATSKSKADSQPGSWLGAVALFAYAVLFSYAYIKLDTATGALVLFGTVQLSLIGYGCLRGETLSLIDWFGVLLAGVGFVYLLWPELTSPSADALLMMIGAGFAWAAYTANGKTSTDPLADTAYNFLRTLPFCLLLLIMLVAGLLTKVQLSGLGLALAVLSGAITSGVGYAIWYAALRDLTRTTAAVSQLTVPIIAAIMGITLAGEALSIHLMLSAALVLGGVLLVTLAAPKQDSSATIN